MTLYEQMVCILIITVLAAITVALGVTAGRYVQHSTSGYVDKLDRIGKPGQS